MIDAQQILQEWCTDDRPLQFRCVTDDEHYEICVWVIYVS